MMSSSDSNPPLAVPKDNRVVEERFTAALHELHTHHDRFFARFMLCQWAATIILAAIVSPRTWEGRSASTHPHVWAAIVLGGIITALPAWLGLTQSGRTHTRHAIAIGQMLMSALLIHLTGGRIETHFHVFGSLAFLAFYRDVPVLFTATIVVYLDHLLRGIFWPESVYGVLTAEVWRSAEHAFWVLFEIAFLGMSIRLSRKEMRQVVRRQIILERINRVREQQVRERTSDLAASEERFRSFFRDSPIGLYRADATGEFQTVNPAMLELLGFTSLDELRASAATSAIALDDRERAQFVTQLGATDDVLTRDITWQRRDGKPVHVRESARAFRDATGAIVRIDGAVEDISERRHLEERYLHAQKVQAIGQLAGGVAHDFNNILTAINGYTDILLRDATLNPAAQHSAEQIQAAGRRAANLTRQLLAFSRKQRLEPRMLQLNTIVEEMQHMLQRLVGHHVKIRTASVSGLWPVRADPGQIQQVVLNLAVNARDAMPHGGQLTIETSNVTLDQEFTRLNPDVTAGDYVLLLVSDTGTGMTEEVKSRLFEPFFTTKAPGTGLGLATCHGIVKQSNGHIIVESEPGLGTTFRIYLPAVAVDAPATSVATPRDDVAGSGETVLLVEDDAGVRDLALRVLRGLGYNVIAAANGVEALALFNRSRKIHLILTDVVMPEMGGPELVQRVRAVAPDVHVLFMSGYTFDALAHGELHGPKVAFLQKPFGTEQLGAAVSALLKTGAAPGPGRN